MDTSTGVDDPGLLRALEYWSAALRPRIGQLNTSIVEARELVDNDIGAVKHVLSSLRSRRNEFAPISRIPPEILERIFASLVDIHPPHVSKEIPPKPDGKFLGWIVITHVCRRWRRVALENPTLWQNILCDLGQEWMEEFVTRSRAVPLTVNMGRSSRTLVHITPLLFRTEKLVFEGSSAVFTKDMFATPAPILTTFVAHMKTPSGWGFIPPLPEDIFAHGIPSLHTIELRNCLVPWSSLPVGNLTHLSVDLTGKADTPPSGRSDDYTDLLDFLERTPTLETFILVKSIPRRLQNTDDRVVFLPHLRLLDLYGPASDCLSILSQVRVPHDAVLSLSMVSINRVHDAWYAALTLISAHISPPSQTSSLVRALDLQIDCSGRDQDYDMSLTAWRNYREFGQSDVANFYLYIRFVWRDPPDVDSVTKLVDHVQDALIPASLESLSVTSPDYGINWTALSKRCNNIRYLYIGGLRTAPCFLEECLRNISGGDNATNSDPDGLVGRSHTAEHLFPRVQSFKVGKVDFSAISKPGEMNPTFDFFLRWLRERKDLALETLSFEGCSIMSGHIEVLRESGLVPTVLRDGKKPRFSMAP